LVRFKAVRIEIAVITQLFIKKSVDMLKIYS